MARALRAYAGPAAALAAAAADEREDSGALLVLGPPADALVHAASMTPFGPSVWTSERRGIAVAEGMVADSARHSRTVHLFAEDRGVATALKAVATRAGASVDLVPGDRDADVAAALADALAAFRAGKATDVVAVVGGVERTRLHAVAPYADDDADVLPGDVVALVATPAPGGVLLAWRKEGDGTDCGTFGVLDRTLTEREERLVARSRATVLRFAYGRVPVGTDEEDFLRTRLFLLDAPCSLTRAFPDRKLPRHGVARDAVA